MDWIRRIAGGIYCHFFGVDLFILKNRKKISSNLIFDVNKSLAFFPQQSKDLELYRYCLAETDMVWTDNIYKQLRVISFLQLVRLAARNNPQGAFLELGVWRGLSSLMIAKVLRGELCSDQHLILIDSFEGGLSEKRRQDKNLVVDQSIVQIQEEKLQFASRRDEVATVLSEFQSVTIHEGWVPEILDRLSESETYAFVHFDMDLFEPTEKALTTLWDKVLPDGIIIFDDYNSTQFPGVTEAVSQFVAKQRDGIEIFFEVPFGSAWILKK